MLTTIRLHGELAQATGRAEWRVAIKQPREAIAAIDANCNGRLTQYLRQNQDGEFKVLVDGEAIQNTERTQAGAVHVPEAFYLIGNFETIDIMPVPAGSGLADWVSVLLGVVLIIVGIIFIESPAGVPLIVMGAGLLVGGAIGLLSPAPKLGTGNMNRTFAPQSNTLATRAEDDPRNSTSYLFNGSANTTAEGGPVPIVYGEMVVGSHLVSLALVQGSLQDQLIGESRPPAPSDDFFDLPVWTTIDDDPRGDVLYSARGVNRMTQQQRQAAWDSLGLPELWPAGSPHYGRRQPPAYPQKQVTPAQKRTVLIWFSQFFNGPRKSLSKAELLNIYFLAGITSIADTKHASWKEIALAIAEFYAA